MPLTPFPANLARRVTTRSVQRARHLACALGVGRLPDFLVIGAQRCGTTSFYHQLTSHALVQSALRKETHFFDDQYDRGLDWYRSYFPLAHGPNQITGEATPYYLRHPRVAERVARHLPDVRIIVLLRDPVERADSQYRLSVRRGRETLSFSEALAIEADRTGPSWDTIAQHESPAGSAHAIASDFSYQKRGIYHEQLRQWFDHIPREQFLILESETYYSQPAETCAAALEFLGINSDGWRPPAIHHNQRPPETSPLHPDDRARLTEFFRPHNRELAALLDRSFSWTDD